VDRAAHPRAGEARVPLRVRARRADRRDPVERRAILLLTPVVVELLRAVYPRRNPKFLLPFAFCAFVAAGVAPLPTGNPMNLVVAFRAGITFNDYAIHMIPVALAGWLVAYAMLAWCYREVLDDAAPALGAAPPVVPLSGHAKAVLAATGASVLSYPILAACGQPIWPVAAVAAAFCLGAAVHRGVRVRAVARGVSWELLPFLFGVLVLADRARPRGRDRPAPGAVRGVAVAAADGGRGSRRLARP